jgi:hypothetical protein
MGLRARLSLSGDAPGPWPYLIGSSAPWIKVKVVLVIGATICPTPKTKETPGGVSGKVRLAARQRLKSGAIWGGITARLAKVGGRI